MIEKGEGKGSFIRFVGSGSSVSGSLGLRAGNIHYLPQTVNVIWHG